MSSSRLLAHVVSSRGLQPEPVATDALAHILENSEAGRSVVQGIAQSLSPEGTYDDLVFTGQAVSAKSEGRPDLVGADTSGPRVLIEAKFDAALTGPQLGTGYLNWLPEAHHGVLIYLVPANRMPALWPTLLQGPCGLIEVPPPDLAHSDVPWLSHPLGDGRGVAAMSWEGLLARLHAAMDGAGDTAASADLVQLDGLVSDQTRLGWIPLATGDLPDRSGAQLRGLVDAAVQVAYSVGHKVTNATQDNGPGRAVTTTSGQVFRLGIHLTAWASFGMTPLWATVWNDDPVRLQGIREGLALLKKPGGPGVYPVEPRTWGVPIVVMRGIEHGAVAEQIAGVCTRLAELLDALPKAPRPDSQAPDEVIG